MPKTLPEWLAYITTLHSHEIALGLTRVAAVAKKLDVLSFACPVISVAGTNGKGSNVALLTSLYGAAGYRVGSYTSPHLLVFNERICLGGEKVSDNQLLLAFSQVEKARAAIALTYFEFVTLAALWLFQQAHLDVVILEVGLGGRLDAVNIVDADLALITSIALDHIDLLGETREAIAYEKAGIFRPRCPIVCGDNGPPQSLLDAAAAGQSSLYCVNKDFHYSATEDGWCWQYADTIYSALPRPSLLLANAATSLMVVQCLRNRLPIDSVAIKQGLLTAQLAGRFQQYSQPRWLILDVAHNPASAAVLATQLAEHPCTGQTYAVVSMLGDKDINNSLQYLLPFVDVWLVAGLTVARGISAKKMANHLDKLGVTAYHTYQSVQAAYAHALQCSQATDRIVVFGSFHTVAAVLSTLEK